MSYLIRKATKHDLSNIVKVHQAAFPYFFMTQLGESFLIEYYRIILRYEKGILLVYENDNQIIGFVSGFVEPDMFYNFLRNRRWVLGIKVVWSVLKRPGLFKRVLASYGRTGDGREKIANVCELSSVAVLPGQSGYGIGQELVRSFLNQAEAFKASMVYLYTDANNNNRVNQFYSNLGFIRERNFIAPIDRVMIEYRYFLGTH